MEEELVLLSCVAVFIKRKEAVKRRKLLLNLRDDNDPFSMPESIFIQNFRLPKWLCLDLIQELEPHDTQSSSLPFTFRFLASLYFYADGTGQKCVGNSTPISMSQASVSRALYHISKLIATVKRSEIKFPQTSVEMLNTKKGFYKHFGMKGAVGAVDCTYVKIISPQSKDSLYMNAKGYSSINIEAVCDSSLMFTAVNAKFPGSCHDLYIWTKSPIRKHLIRIHNPQRDTWLLGDQAYPLEPWLLTPVTETSNASEREYNKLHAKTRSTIEIAFLVLRSRFRCLSRHRILHYNHERAANIIYACSILHNICLKHGVTTDIDEKEAENVNDKVRIPKSKYLKQGAAIRTRYILSL